MDDPVARSGGCPMRGTRAAGDRGAVGSQANGQGEPCSPCGEVVLATERENARVGHENAGFLSLSHGFVPRLEPRLALDARFAAWDAVAARLPELHRTLSLRREVDALPVLDASAAALEGLA